MDAVENLLMKHPFLTGLNEECRDIFGDCATLRRFAANQRIFQEGSEADHFYLIVSGKVALETFVPGLGMVTVQRLGAGDALGWSWLFPPRQWHFTASTQAPTEVISLDAAALRNKAEENREFRDELLTRVSRTLLERLLATRMQLIDVYGMRP